MLQPTVAQKSGNFSGLAPIVDPLTGQQFPGNIIPSGRISPFAAALLKFAPDPNAAYPTGYPWPPPPQ